MIVDVRMPGEWKIQLTMEIKFMSSKDSSESQSKHSKSNSIEVMIDVDTYKLIGDLFNLLLQRYQNGLEQSMKGNNFVFDFFDGK